jgi:hydrogenase nickel incorporation protein HypA/HybF
VHELALMSSLIERVCTIAHDEKAEHVREIHVACGDVSGVIPEALEFCFDICIADTIAKDATLKIKRIPAQWICAHCTTTTSHVDDKNIPLCPACSGTDLSLIHGREFQLISVIVE